MNIVKVPYTFFVYLSVINLRSTETIIGTSLVSRGIVKRLT